ncbi:MAG: SLC13 family permease [Saprospiraceae bacterium]|nr:SLC13 family permease [Saprospiraceae bacterium]
MDHLEVIVVALVLVFLIISLYREIFQPAITFLIAIITLAVFGILTGEEVLNGFANPQIASILLLLVFGNLLGKASILNVFFSKAFENTKTYNGFLSRLLPSVAGISAFINNTPVVALLIPYVYKWAQKNNVSISKLLIPLSFAAILGGTITLVGTSTNMLVNAFAIKNSDVAFSIFDFAWVGLPITLIGLIYVVVFGRKLLPERQTFSDKFQSSSREYLVEVSVPNNSSYVGKTIAESNLRQLNGLFVVEIIRQNEIITPIRPDNILLANDTLILAGNVAAITELMELNSDLALPKFSYLEGEPHFDVNELVVSAGSFLSNKTVKEADFRSRYNAALVAINRNGERLTGKLGDKQLKTGDALLVLAGSDFYSRGQRDFYTISKVKEVRPLDVKRSLLIFFGLLASVLLSALNILPLFKGLLVLLLLAFIFRILNLRQLRQLVDYNLLVIAALALALGQAIDSVGISEFAATQVINVTQPFGAVGALIGIYIIAFCFTELMTNIAAASLALPFALAIANKLGVSPEPFFLAVAYAASASFVTPLGYQTNLMVYGPGGYKFKDFFRMGFPLSILYFTLTIGILYWMYFRA